MTQHRRERWIDIDQIEIPKIMHKGFEADVLERDLWTGRQDSEPVREAEPVVSPEASGAPEAVEKPEPVIKLIRVNSPEQEEIRVGWDMFTIGKSQKADYTISGNSAISRIHAMIYKEGDTYYLEDQGSLNHTYIDEEMVTAPYPLRDGLVVRLANEDFILKMETE